MNGRTSKRLGIIGGTSWSSTALYYDHINRGVSARLGGLHSAPLTIESLDFEPLAALQEAGDWDGATGLVVDAAERLKRAGVDGLLIASNTMHKAKGAIVAATGLDIVDISDAAAQCVAAERRTHVALLGTRFTMAEAFAREAYEARGIVLHELTSEWRGEVDRIVREELAAGHVVRESQRKLKTLFTELAKAKVQAVVLGCTELVLAVDTRANVLPIYDTTAIHARAAVEWMLSARAEVSANQRAAA